MVRNNLKDLHEDIAELSNLRVINCRHNKLKNSSIPPKMFNLEDLSVLVRMQYIVACQAHRALAKIGPVFVPFLFLVAC